MKEQYEVTIGIPVYKSVDYINDSMCSALNQTFHDIEFLIVDDCGNDGTMDIIFNLKSNHPRGNNIRILSNTVNKGVSYSRNRIIDEARGRYLYFMDSDDVIEPNTIQLLYDSIAQHQSDVAYASYEIIDYVKHGPVELYQKASLILSRNDELAEYVFKHSNVFHVSVCNCLMNLAFLRQTEVRFIDTQFWEDMAFTYELVPKVNSAVLLPNITYHYQRRPNSLSHYQERKCLQKTEILKNISTIDYLKNNCIELIEKDYLPYLCYNLVINSFYMACHILKNNHHIIPTFSYKELRSVIWHPFHLRIILRFKHKLLPNLVLYILGRLPILFFIPSIWLMGKLKKVL